MIKISHAKLRAQDQTWVVAVDPRQVPVGVWRGYYTGVESFLRSFGDELCTGQEKGPANNIWDVSPRLCWVQLSDLVSVPVLHVEDLGDGNYAAVIDARLNPPGVKRSDCCCYPDPATFIAREGAKKTSRTQIGAFRGSNTPVYCWVTLADLPMKQGQVAGMVPTATDSVARAVVTPKLIDGLTRAECLTRYEAWMRDEAVLGVKNRTREGGNRALTAAQLAVAQEEWSAQVKARHLADKAEAARREYQSLAVDDDRWEVD